MHLHPGHDEAEEGAEDDIGLHAFLLFFPIPCGVEKPRTTADDDPVQEHFHVSASSRCRNGSG